MAIDKSALELLDISKSAIHQTWVWSHLLRKRDNMLVDFIGSKSAYRGALYDPPASRSFVKTKAATVNFVAFFFLSFCFGYLLPFLFQ